MDQALKARLIGAAVLVALAVMLIPELLSGRRTAGSDAGAPVASRGTRTFTIELGGGAPAAATNPTAAHVSSIAPTPVSAQTAPAAGPAAPPVATAPVSTVVAGPAGPAGPTGPAGSTAEPDVARPAAGPPSANPAHGPAASAAQPAPSTVQLAPARPVSPPAPSPSPASSQPRGGWAVQVGAFGSAVTAQKMVDELKSAGYRAYLSPVTRSGKTLNRVRVGPETERARADGLAASLKSRGLPATVVGND